MPTLRERLEDNVVYVFGAALVTGFVAGFGAREILPDSGAPASQWEDKARSADWLPKADCPAFPIVLDVKGPGDGSEVPAELSGRSWWLKTDVAIVASHPISEGTTVGLIFNKAGTTNYYIDKGYGLRSNDKRDSFYSGEVGIDLPEALTLEPNAALNIWAVATDNESQLGSIYSSLDQIKATSSTIVLSGKVTVHLLVKEKSSP